MSIKRKKQRKRIEKKNKGRQVRKCIITKANIDEQTHEHKLLTKGRESILMERKIKKIF